MERAVRIFSVCIQPLFTHKPSQDALRLIERAKLERRAVVEVREDKTKTRKTLVDARISHHDENLNGELSVFI